MAKRKPKEDKAEEVVSTETAAWQTKVKKEYGEVWMSAQTIEDDVLKFVPLSPSLDLQVGGLRESSVSIFSGKAKTGKSSLALQALKNASIMFDKPIFFVDIENRFMGLHLHSVKDLPLDKLTVIRSTKQKILSAEEQLEITRDIIKSVPEAVIVLDSTSALCGESELSGKISGSTRAVQPKLLAAFFRSIMAPIAINKTILICLQHLITNTSGYGAAFWEDGGVKIVHAGGSKFRAKGVQPWADPAGKIIGQVTTWDIVFNSFGAPGAKVETHIKYGEGISDAAEILNLGIDLGLVSKAGSWLEYNGNKVQGAHKMCEYLEENEDIRKGLYEDIKEMVK